MTTPTEASTVDAYRGEPSRCKLVEVAKYYLFIGIVGFGGPLVHIAMMEDDLVGEGRTHAEFDVGSDSWSVDFLLVALLVAAIVATVVLNPNPVVEFVVAGLVVVAIYRSDWLQASVRRVSAAGVVTALLGGLYLLRDRLLRLAGPRVRGVLEASPVWGLLVALWANPWVKLFLFMVYTGSFIYGGGLVLIPFVEKYVVNEFAWLTAREFVDVHESEALVSQPEASGFW